MLIALGTLMIKLMISPLRAAHNLTGNRLPADRDARGIGLNKRFCPSGGSSPCRKDSLIRKEVSSTALREQSIRQTSAAHPSPILPLDLRLSRYGWHGMLASQ